MRKTPGTSSRKHFNPSPDSSLIGEGAKSVGRSWGTISHSLYTLPTVANVQCMVDLKVPTFGGWCSDSPLQLGVFPVDGGSLSVRSFSDSS